MNITHLIGICIVAGVTICMILSIVRPWRYFIPKKHNKDDNIVQEDVYEIEHYPLTNNYFAKLIRKGYYDVYLKTNYPTGIPETIREIMYAEKCRTEKEARDLINKYKEYHNKINVKTIKV